MTSRATDEEKEAVVTLVLQELGLGKAKHTIVGMSVIIESAVRLLQPSARFEL